MSGMSGLRIVPVDLAAAREFVSAHHRHHEPPHGHKFSVGVADGTQLVGVAIVGRPVSRVIQAEGATLEVPFAAAREPRRPDRSHALGDGVLSAGPIKQWRDAHKPHLVSTPDSARICAPNIDTGRAVCGRKNPTRIDVWSKVTCADCHAAARADKEEKR